MNRLRIVHAGCALLLGLAVALLMHGHLRLPVAIVCFVCLALIVSAEAFRVSTATTARKVKP